MRKTGMKSENDTTINHWNTPVYNAIKAYADSGTIPFHMPGHKLGRGVPDEYLSEIEKLDLTEIPGTDNLHAPTGVLKEAQELAAAAFGAKESFFLVNGSTIGLHVAISAVCKHGQRLIVGRDCHKAAINGMLLAGAVPVYIIPEYSAEFGIHTGMTPLAVKKALLDAPDAAGVLITRPNYYGVCSDISEIARIVHLHKKILIVDEAHGSHLVFSRRLPVCALEAGADLCIQSAHKTLPAFTQGALLHIGSDRVDRERICYYLDLYQTTSPSYVIMAYLDIAREIMQKSGKAMLDGLLDTIEAFAGEFYSREVCHGEVNRGEACRGEVLRDDIRLLSRLDIPGFEHDDTRITVDVSGLGMTGYAAEKLLRDRYHIQVEMSDLKNIVCIATVADDRESIACLFSALTGLSELARAEEGKPDVFTGVNAISLPDFRRLTLPKRVMMPQKILDAQVDMIPLEEAEGRTSGGIVSPYPPGIALVCPGERFSREMIEYIKYIIRAGGVVHGIREDGTAAILRGI